ncbi:MDR family oxidoreductase [Salisaeta longa]|uniref:MDR family oxidoreductase n=1 Tax=Salisaeta longa TaxID=503170 RepID=UPI0003B43FA9|nr:MDR family oxidoreductase [Salisaeta longa]
MFDAFVLEATDDGYTGAVQSLTRDDLPPADTLLDVLYSSVNYKDGLAITGAGKIIRGDFPMVPGIDLVGRVIESAADRFAPGDRVIGTGWQLGEAVWGGYTQEARVASEKLVALPEGLAPHDAMVIGTAGLTAMLSVLALEDHGCTPTADGEVVVTGASGGAGSIATALLAARGYRVVASTGSADAYDYLRQLGAARIIDRHDLSEGPSRPMESARWMGAVDAVGGDTLATLIAQMARHGSIAAFGNAGGASLHTTVFPFILRGVNLLGIDSNTCPNTTRATAWDQLATLLDAETLARLTNRVIGLHDLPDAARDIVHDSVRGRIVVDVHA